MDYEKILREFIEDKVESAQFLKANKTLVLNLRGQAFGALMFAQEANLIPYEKLHIMWEDPKHGYWHRFEEILRRVK